MVYSKQAPVATREQDQPKKPTLEATRVVESVETSEKARELLHGKKVEKRFTNDEKDDEDYKDDD